MRCRSNSTSGCSTYRGSRGSGSAAAMASSRPSRRSTWRSCRAPPSYEIGSASKTVRTLRAPRNGNSTCVTAMRSKLQQIFRNSRARRFLAGQTAHRAHVHAVSVLMSAHVEDEPHVVGEQALLPLSQATNQPGNVDRWIKPSLQLCRDLRLGDPRDEAIPHHGRRIQPRAPLRFGLRNIGQQRLGERHEGLRHLGQPRPEAHANGADRCCGRARFSRRRLAFRSSRCGRARSLAMRPGTYQAAPTPCLLALDEALPPVNHPG